MKPFDLEKAIAGHPLVTRDGRKVLDFHYFKAAEIEFPIYALLEKGVVESYKINGMNLQESASHYDLLLAPLKKTYWVNVYRYGSEIQMGGSVYDCEQKANDANDNSREKLKTISFEIEE